MDRRAPDPLWRIVVGTVLRAERRLQGLTLREAAAVAGLSVPYLSEIERSRKEAASEMLAAAAKALGLRLVDRLARAHDTLAEHERRSVAGTTGTPRPDREHRCQRHLVDGLRRRRATVEVLHLAELLARALV